MRAIDVHVHVPSSAWIDRCLEPYLESTERFFKFPATGKRTTVPQMAELFEELDVVGCLLAWDAETATGRPRLSNDEVVEICARYPGRFVPIASVDPHKGEEACRELERAVRDLGCKGLKVHPSLQAFRPDDRAFAPLWATAEALGIPVICHTGTSGIGAGMPGGQGIKLGYARPIHLDAVLADFPALRIVLAHFGWPWTDEALAIAQHKANAFLDVSGWAPRYLPEAVVREMRGRLRDKVLFGSDYPFIAPERCLEELGALGLGDQATALVLRDNAARLFGIETA